jgi:hypothetical protein
MVDLVTLQGWDFAYSGSSGPQLNVALDRNVPACTMFKCYWLLIAAVVFATRGLPREAFYATRYAQTDNG